MSALLDQYKDQYENQLLTTQNDQHDTLAQVQSLHKNELTKLNEKIENLLKELNEKTQKIEFKERDYSMLSVSLYRMKKEKEEKEEYIKQLELKMKENTTFLNQVNQDASTLENKVLTLKKKLISLKEENTQLKQTLQVEIAKKERI